VGGKSEQKTETIGDIPEQGLLPEREKPLYQLVKRQQSFLIRMRFPALGGFLLTADAVYLAKDITY